MYLFFVLAIITIACLIFINLPTPSPIFSVYRQPDKWYYFKISIFYSALKIKEIYEKIKNDDASGERSKKHHIFIARMEFPRKLVYNPQAIDSVSFMASDKKRYFLATYLGRRYNGVVDGFIYLNIPEIGLLESLKLPDTILFQDNKEKSLRSFGAEGLHHTPLQPLKRWKISYDGKMRVRGNTKDIVHVHLDAIWTSRLPFYDVNRDTDTMLLAKIFAKEPWNDDFFGIVKDFHLTHFEQHGNITGQAVVNGEIFQLKMNSLKSRKHGILKWKHMHRYVTHFMHFQDGTSISVGMISTPVTFSSKEYGFITTANGELYPITYSSLKLHELGEAGTPPKDYSFSIKAGGRTYHIQVEVFKCAEFYAGWQWEARIVECMAKFTFNGNPGWGGVEWHYRHTGRRPLSIASMDPEWTKEKNESHTFSIHRKQPYGPIILPFQINNY